MHHRWVLAGFWLPLASNQWQNRSMSDPVGPGALQRQRHCNHQACRSVFVLCVGCDRGQRYCSDQCRQAARRAQRSAANRRYQQSDAGRRAHRQCQRRYRDREVARVTDQGSHSIIEPTPLRAKCSPSVCVICQRQGRWFDISAKIAGEWRRTRSRRNRLQRLRQRKPLEFAETIRPAKLESSA